MQAERIRARDGAILDVFRSGLENARTLVFVNALGVKAGIALNLEGWSLGEGYGFLTWETRGFPGDGDGDFRNITPADHARDLISILDHYAIANPVLLAWCSGCHIALRAAKDFPRRVERLILVNGHYYLGSSRLTPDSQMMRAVLEKVVRQERSAAGFVKLLKSYGDPEEGSPGSITDPIHPRRVGEAFRESADALLRYAHLTRHLPGNRVEDWAGSLDCPIMIIGSRKDSLVEWQEAERLSGLIPDSECRILENADHYGIFQAAGLTADILHGIGAVH